MTDLRYPIGKFNFEAPVAESEYPRLIGEVAEAPGALRSAIAGMSRDQLETPYRPGGWTVRQVVHHLPDSHMNAYTRFKLALTEDEPAVKGYEEAKWAELSDSQRVPVEVSLDLLESLHLRWVPLLRGMDGAAFQRRLRHPSRGLITLAQLLALYAWHGRHHVAHITGLREREGWQD
ncbi:MAG TPA: putative metal-dependent hydrolase [Gemmatimonadaceae bacterium]|nr:putative metal-dependent hydrolase [Gemmatimonadaceae bacterium]